MGWMIEVHGAKFREEQVTGAHLTMVNTFVGSDTWAAVDPMSSPTALMMWAAIAVSEMTKLPLDETVLMVQRMPLQELLACYNPDAPQEAEAAAPTPPAAPQRPLVAPWPTEADVRSTVPAGAVT
jgi:hypothetical protein